MRSYYPVSSAEGLCDVREIQEALIYLIGYDSNLYDNYIDTEGVIGTMINSIDASGMVFIKNRVYDDGTDGPMYSQFYRASLVSMLARRL